MKKGVYNYCFTVMGFKNLVSIFLLFFLISCGNQEKKDVGILLQAWSGKEIQFPEDLTFTVKGADTVDFSVSGKYKILTYVDSIGCVSCKLQLGRWKALMKELGEAEGNPVKFLFFFSPEKRRDFLGTLKSEDFVYPVCLDEEDRLNKLNHFSSEMAFQTFLLDSDNRVLAVDNPIHNPKVKELYLRIIQGEQISQGKESKQIMTEVVADKSSVSLASFDWHKEHKATFTLKNAGGSPLVIQDVTTSCGCTTVSYSKEPAQPGKEITLEAVYKAEHPEHFSKTVTVYCNTASSPIRLSLSGDAK